jgi:mannose-6-phosphate isomerase-like protein (cupin superfamily)
LQKEFDVKFFNKKSRTIGFCRRGSSERENAVISQIPDDLSGSPMSVCGVKGFLIDEIREFEDEKGKKHKVPCASVAALDIIDSPVHVHGETIETYLILAGFGKMVLDQRVCDVKPGHIILVVPGAQHGLVSDDVKSPLKVLMTFHPGLAPIEMPAFRDEKIVYANASRRIVEIARETRYDREV